MKSNRFIAVMWSMMRDFSHYTTIRLSPADMWWLPLYKWGQKHSYFVIWITCWLHYYFRTYFYYIVNIAQKLWLNSSPMTYLTRSHCSDVSSWKQCAGCEYPMYTHWGPTTHTLMADYLSRDILKLHSTASQQMSRNGSLLLLHSCPCPHCLLTVTNEQKECSDKLHGIRPVLYMF